MRKNKLNMDSFFYFRRFKEAKIKIFHSTAYFLFTISLWAKINFF